MTDITELAQSKSLRKKLNRRLNDAYGFQRTSGGKHTTISLSIAECESVIAALEKHLVLLEALEKAQRSIAELENYAEAEAAGADRAAEDSVYWMKRCKELESRSVKLPKRHSMLLREDFNDDYHTEMAYKADEVHASLAAAGIKVEAE
ncbi:TPA: ead/Ea22-like family protein [Klebsiella pneumoniae]|nr:ead/Ea22-like family protein [Klebsiella pneumoniae]